MKTLIAYRTQYGSTRRCAELIRAGIGGDVTLADLKTDPRLSVDPYDVVIIGGSIYAGLIQREVVAFCSRNREQLLARHVGLYICCLYREERADAQLASAYPQWLLDRAFVRLPFGGRLDVDKLKPMDRFLVERVGQFSGARDLLRYDRIEELCRAVRALREESTE